MKITYTICLTLFFINAWSQSQILPLSSDFSYYIEKEVLMRNLKTHSAIQPYLAYQAKIDSSFLLNSPNVFFSFSKFWSKDLYKFSKSEFNISINPIIDTHFGRTIDTSNLIGKLGLGFQLKIDYKKLSLFAALSGSATGLNGNELLKAEQSMIVPEEGHAISQRNNWYNHIGFVGHISWKPSEFFDFAIGRGKNFIGDGCRSLLLSDASSPYNYARISAQVWRFRYMMLYQAMQDVNGNNISSELFHKFQVSHILSLNVCKSFNVYAFETVVSNSLDTLGNRGFELNYLNPFIFYRPVEFSLGSPDNVLLGVGGKMLVDDKFSIYTQFSLDEFIWSHLLKQDNWWANKYGWQLGFKYLDALGLVGLSLQMEYNTVRPFTYSHDDPISNYGNMYQPLAHPLGANFKELINIFSFTHNRNNLSLRSSYSIYGTDPYSNKSWGADIYKTYTIFDKDKEFGNTTGQGIEHKMTNIELKYVYLINPKWNLQFEVSVGTRILKTIEKTNKQTIIQAGLRTALFRNNYGVFK